MHSTRRFPPIQFLVLILGDLRGLFIIQGALLAFTFLITPSDVGDIRVQVAWMAFLLPGWCLSAWWTGSHASLAIRYTHAVIGTVGIHASLVCIGALFRLSFLGYFAGLVVVTVLLLVMRGRYLFRTHARPRIRLSAVEWIVWLAIMLLVVSIYREPRSADIIQFSLQQQDMAAHQSLQPSSIGMEAMGVKEAMPRWRSHYWHLVPSLLADITSLPVDGVLRRWATIPIAFSAIVVLVSVVGRFSGRGVPIWAVAIAVFGPVVLWYRSYNAFNYSFRLTNNFCLDKDVCLFLLIPATIYLAVRWIRGSKRNLLPLVLLIPAAVKFHPMTAVYLALLVPFVVIGYDRHTPSRVSRAATESGFFRRLLVATRMPSKRALVWIAFCGLLFIVALAIGDAQTAHSEIGGIVRMDWRDHQAGRPLHYWVGHYAAIPENGLPLDTTEWSAGRIHLRARVLLNCGLLGMMHVAWLIGAIAIWWNHDAVARQRWWALTVVIAMLWGIWLLAPVALTWRPHFLAGYERLHWFAYVPALVAVSAAITSVAQVVSYWAIAFRGSTVKNHLSGIDPRVSCFATFLVVTLLIYSGVCFRLRRESLWSNVRFLNSLLDFELPAQVTREQSYDPSSIDRDLDSTRPEYLVDSDRVLFLDNSGNNQYWLIKQGVFWSEPYAEAYAWQIRGDDFLEDRHFFYLLLDRQPLDSVATWLNERQVTLLVDRRPGADSYLAELNEREKLGMRRLSTGVWRRGRVPR